MRHPAINGGLIAAIVVLTAGAAQAQQSLQVPIQFDFLSPGARSLALGSAFVAVADDATAAWTNPAGLWNLPDSEISLEGRFSGTEQQFMTGGRLSGQVSGRLTDVVAGPQFAKLSADRTGLSFLSFVYSMRKLKIAAYRHELLRVDQSFDYAGVFQFEPNLRFDNRDIAFTGDRKIVIDNYGVSVGRQLGPLNRKWGPVLVGAGISFAKFSLDYQASTFLHQTFYGAPDPIQMLARSKQSGDEWAIGATAGVLVPIRGIVTIGAAYRNGPSFHFTSTVTPTTTNVQTSAEERFDVPDVIAAGVRIGPFSSPRATWQVTTEYKRVQNSELRSSYVASFLRVNDPSEKAYAFSIDDSNEFHLGAEYVLSSRRWRPSFRGGLWYDPDHSVQYSSPTTNDLYDERFRASLSTGKDLMHYTFGLGLLASRQLEFNIAGDASSRSTVISASAIVRFRKTPPKPPDLPPLE